MIVSVLCYPAVLGNGLIDAHGIFSFDDPEWPAVVRVMFVDQLSLICQTKNEEITRLVQLRLFINYLLNIRVDRIGGVPAIDRRLLFMTWMLSLLITFISK